MRYKLFGRSGLRVSEISLGTMTFGTEWGWGAEKEESKKIFDTYANAGGNFIDTANRYTEGTSEKYVGEFIESDREHFVVATKYTLRDRMNDPNFSGNHRKNMMRSVNDSLERLGTDYIDVLWVHAWDFMTPVDEVMRGLDDLVSMGLVHYIGISDTPAWIVSQANTIADFRGWSRFVGLQIEYSLIQRTAERDLIPMAKALDLAVTPWSPLAGGVLTGKYIRGEEGRIVEESNRRQERATKIAQAVVDVAKEMDVTPAQLALRWTMQKEHTSIPIVGGRKASQLKDSLGCLDFSIPDNFLSKLDEASQIKLGFPHDFLNSDTVKNVVYGDTHTEIDTL